MVSVSWKCVFSFLMFQICIAQNVNRTVAVGRTVAARVNKIVLHASTGSFYASEWPGSMVKFDSHYNVIWEKTWTGGWNVDGCGTRSHAVHESGEVIIVGDSWGAVNGAGGTLPAGTGWTQYFVQRMRADGTIMYTSVLGGTNYEFCNDATFSSDTSGSFFYVTGMRKGNYIQSPTACCTDSMLLKFNFADASIVWAYVAVSAVPGAEAWDEGYRVAEISPTRVQMFIGNGAANSYLITLNAATGAYMSYSQIPFNDWLGTFYDQRSGLWWSGCSISKRIVAFATNGEMLFSYSLASFSLNLQGITVDTATMNAFVGFKGPNSLFVYQIGLLSGSIFYNEWVPAVSTDAITSMTVISRTLVVGGTGFTRFFPNVTFADACPDRTLRTNLTCSPCPPGSYFLNSSCISCPWGSFCADGSRAVCGPNSNTTGQSASLVSNCTCNPGYYGNNGNCQICPSGSFCPGGNRITNCSANSNSTAGSATVQQCQCAKGYYGASGNCTICPRGSFCPGAMIPTGCGANANTSTIGASTASQCICNPGYYGINGNCIPCPYGFFCQGGSLAETCPNFMNTTSTMSTSLKQCSCAAGYVEVNNACQPCPKGSYCSGGKNISRCPDKSSSADTGAMSLANCVCNSGYYGQPDQCTLCPLGSYCPGGLFKLDCSPNSQTSNTGSQFVTDCVCVTGYYGVNGNCKVCERGFFCVGGPDAQACPMNANTASIASSKKEDCRCNSGYYESNQACQICPTGSFCPGGKTKTDCPENSVSEQEGSQSINDCKCKPGFFGDPVNSCMLCPIGSYCLGGPSATACFQNSNTSTAGAQSEKACFCNKADGFVLNQDGTQCFKPPEGSLDFFTTIFSNSLWIGLFSVVVVILLSVIVVLSVLLWRKRKQPKNMVNETLATTAFSLTADSTVSSANSGKTSLITAGSFPLNATNNSGKDSQYSNPAIQARTIARRQGSPMGNAVSSRTVSVRSPAGLRTVRSTNQRHP